MSVLSFIISLANTHICIQGHYFLKSQTGDSEWGICIMTRSRDGFPYLVDSGEDVDFGKQLKQNIHVVTSF